MECKPYVSYEPILQIYCPHVMSLLYLITHLAADFNSCSVPPEESTCTNPLVSNVD